MSGRTKALLLILQQCLRRNEMNCVAALLEVVVRELASTYHRIDALLCGV